MSAQPSRTSPRAWGLRTVFVLVLLGAWVLLGGTGGCAGRTPATPTVGAPATPTTSEPTGRPSERASEGAPGQSSIDPTSGLPLIATADLPREARSTLELIDNGGPFPYAKDGSTFGNFEGVLPQQRRGFYKEYTVETPGSRDRGPRRIVTGDNDRIHYWTDDHYETFRRIRR